MADQKITDYTLLAGAAIADGDQLELVDVSDTSMAATGTNKRTSVADLKTVAHNALIGRIRMAGLNLWGTVTW